ncbi:MAG: hypothetical protein V1720_18945 [bacterium]
MKYLNKNIVDTETLSDDLLFDSRRPDNVLQNSKERQSDYADIAKRWMEGIETSKQDEKLIAKILLGSPELFLTKSIDNDKICVLIKKLQSSSNLSLLEFPYKVLCLYMVFVFSIKEGNIMETRIIMKQIARLINNSFPGKEQKPSRLNKRLNNIFFNEQDDKQFKDIEPYIKTAITKVIIMIMDSPGLLLIGKGFNIGKFPLPPMGLMDLNPAANINNALEYYRQQQYDIAQNMYRHLMIQGIDRASTFVHMARVEISHDNIAQADYYIAMAWRIRNEGPDYVKCRIIYFIILIKMLGSEPFDIWLSVMLQSTKKYDIVMDWQMDYVLQKYKKVLGKRKFTYMQALLHFLSSGKMPYRKKPLKLWENVRPLPEISWPRYK